MAVIIFGFWNVPVIRNLINPLKLFTIGWHELCHIIVVSLFSPPSQLRWIKTLFIGHPDRRSNIEDNDRSVCWRSHNCGGWYSDSDSLGRLHRIDVVRWSIYSCRIHQSCGEDYEFRAGHWSSHASCAGAR